MRRTKNKTQRANRRNGSRRYNKTIGKQRGGQMSFDNVGMPSNAIPLNGHEVDPIAMQQSSRLSVPVISGGKKNSTQKRRHIFRFKKHVRFGKGKKIGGGIFSDWLIGGPSSTTQNAVVQFGTSSGAKFTPDVLSGASYGQTPYTDMRIPIKPMV
jgi:hypothetical protein